MDRIRDPEGVGEAARERYRQVLHGMSKVSSVSPLQLTWINGAMLVEPDQAREIDRFYSTEVGERWLQVQHKAAVASRASRKEMSRKLCDGGWARDRFEALDAFLPKDKSGR